jgi:hypothetical protein
VWQTEIYLFPDALQYSSLNGAASQMTYTIGHASVMNVQEFVFLWGFETVKLLDWDTIIPAWW